MKRIAALLMLVATTAAAEPNVTLYQLQDQCGKRAAEVVRQDDARASYKSHYNARHNKCFAIETIMSNGTRRSTLFDVNANEEYGSYMFDYKQNQSIMCYVVEDRGCGSEAEWNALVKPYMEE